MIRKFVVATLMIALAALFYYTDRIEPDQSSVSAIKSRIVVHYGTSASMSSTSHPN